PVGVWGVGLGGWGDEGRVGVFVRAGAAPGSGARPGGPAGARGDDGTESGCASGGEQTAAR
ncbi:hypothetical protein, partial [Nocardia brasiliensis]|uniref:hypothetical protein n=1 Tax=Nocardia brasiliensis TaxID=37326 RepID=UPI0024590DFD